MLYEVITEGQRPDPDLGLGHLTCPRARVGLHLEKTQGRIPGHLEPEPGHFRQQHRASRALLNRTSQLGLSGLEGGMTIPELLEVVDLLPGGLLAEQHRGGDQQKDYQPQTEPVARITSYNVCYTKLLRNRLKRM